MHGAFDFLDIVLTVVSIAWYITFTVRLVTKGNSPR